MSATCSPEFTKALELFHAGEYEPIRAYFDLIPGKRWAACDACGEMRLLGPSGLMDKLTCEACEADISANLGQEEKP